MNRLINNIRSLFAAIVRSIVSFVRRTFLFNKLCHKFESRKPGFRRELHDVIKAIKEIYKTTPQPLTQLDHLRIYRLAEAFYVKYHEFDRPDFAYKFSPFHIMHAYCALPDFQEVIDVYKESTTLEEAQHDIGARMILFDAPLSMFKYHVMQVLYHMPSKQVVRVYGLRLMEEFMIDENHTEQVPGYLVKPLHSNNRCFMTVEDRLVVWNHCKMCLRAGLDLCKDPDPYRNDVVCGNFVKANENKYNLVYLHARLGAYRYYEDAQKAREEFIIMNSEIAEDDIRIVAIDDPQSDNGICIG